MWIKKVAETPLNALAKVIDNLDAQPNDRQNAPSIRAVREVVLENWTSVYPVGSIYMSVNAINPGTLFGGTWNQIKDKFLLACGDTYSNGETGGSATHTPSGSVGNHALTTTEIPSHTHSYTKATGVGNHKLTVDEMPSHNHVLLTDSAGSQTVASGSMTISQPSLVPVSNTGNTGGDGAHNHPINTASDNTGSTGSGSGHNHTFTGTNQNTLPPYLAVNVWVRVA